MSTSHDRSATDLLQIGEPDLEAYSEGRLDTARRAEIEGFLACNPDLAARMMRVLHSRKRAAAASGERRRPLGTRIAVACAACAVAGWAFAVGLDDDGPLQGLVKAPEYVEDAVMSGRATTLRIRLNSQVQTRMLDTAELRDNLRIRLPVLPQAWRLLDMQVYPSEVGPSVSLLLETPAGRQFNLFAVRSNTAATGEPELASIDGAFAAYWELDGSAYVLTGDGSSHALLAQATQLSRGGLM